MTGRAISQELSKTEKLNGTNFHVWKCRISHILFQDKVEYVIDNLTSTSLHLKMLVLG